MSEKSELPAHHVDSSGTAFQNPWMQPKGLLASGQVLAQWPLAFERDIAAHHITPIQVVKPDFGGHDTRQDAIKATWLGHAVCSVRARTLRRCTLRLHQGFMVEMPHDPSKGAEPVRILFDPIWSQRASPNQYAGPKRRLPPPCPLGDLPDFQFVVTSHNQCAEYTVLIIDSADAPGQLATTISTGRPLKLF
jgi:N-acyl-phosphatidylethanolamine-hydrolysing phospholipase D